uniref:Flagellar protein FlaG n=1 Tax=Mesoaciditoga lauensis TaxID=1495039 RepID=A0A7V3VTA8_9BACT
MPIMLGGGMKMANEINGVKSTDVMNYSVGKSSGTDIVKDDKNAQSVQKSDENKANSKNSDQLKDLAKKLSDFQKIVNVSFQYEILKNPNMIVIKMIDDNDGEVIKQIPPEAAVKLAKAIDELLGVFVDKHV